MILIFDKDVGYQHISLHTYASKYRFNRKKTHPLLWFMLWIYAIYQDSDVVPPFELSPSFFASLFFIHNGQVNFQKELAFMQIIMEFSNFFCDSVFFSTSNGIVLSDEHI